MRAAYIEAHGDASEILVGELPTPRPGPGQVLLRVGAAAINPIDLYLRSGRVAMPMSFPYVVGTDVAGTVEEVGPGVTRFRPGDRAWGSNQGILGRQGSAAEFACTDEGWLHPTPPGLSDPEAASIAMVGLTAHLGLFDRARLGPGESVYVAGGGGGVGSMVVQMAKAVGARVATTAGQPASLDLCRRLGADLVLNYKEDDVPARLREWSEEGIDVWYETQRDPDLMTIVPLLRKRGRLVLMAGRDATPTLPLGSFYPRNCSIFGFAMFNYSADEQLICAEDMARWLSQGLLRPSVGRTFPLDQAAQAEQFLEDNTVGGAGTLVGKVVITIGEG
ncbi:NADPH:quinone reductase [Tautonia plasticadhaerens]|uniref:Zinc-type alcohol dehydrogenase-like protein n=1 Tax=Tautonia plasticadhaerens TaxID=2527974 RepID=A0A518GX27_9BACT|nr:NADPH:quinone reductase [Tautonia plasticadhaerens]QDV33139.1 Zinc-type alcohol dehydrogenase-like protein [Tautonia plasticadhaerens]